MIDVPTEVMQQFEAAGGQFYFEAGMLTPTT
jgi:hypothetical protein